MSKSAPKKLAAEYGPEDVRARLLTGNLILLMALEANGLTRKASELVDHIGRGLTRQSNRRARYWREVEERRRAARLNAPLALPEPEPAINRDLRALGRAEAEAAEARADADKAWKADDRPAHRAAMTRLKAAQDRIRVLRRGIDAARTAQLDRRWAETARGETEALAVLRGEEIADETTEVPEWLRDPETGALVREDGLPVLRVERTKAKRVLSRSGIDLAFVRGDLGEGTRNPMRLREIGRRYAAAYEAAAARLTPASHEVRGSGVPEPQLSSVAAWNELAIMRGTKPGLGLSRLTPKQRAVLDQVCGLGNTIGGAARELRAGVPSVRRALRGGLEVAGDNMKTASELRASRKMAA